MYINVIAIILIIIIIIKFLSLYIHETDKELNYQINVCT